MREYLCAATVEHLAANLEVLGKLLAASRVTWLTDISERVKQWPVIGGLD